MLKKKQELQNKIEAEANEILAWLVSGTLIWKKGCEPNKLDMQNQSWRRTIV